MDKKLTDDIVAYRKGYYERNRDRYKEYVLCEVCGCRYQLFNKSHHKKLKKHILAVERKESERILRELELSKSKMNLSVQSEI